MKTNISICISLPINGALMSSLELDPPQLSPVPAARNFCKLKDFLCEPPPLHRKYWKVGQKPFSWIYFRFKNWSKKWNRFKPCLASGVIECEQALCWCESSLRGFGRFASGPGSLSVLTSTAMITHCKYCQVWGLKIQIPSPNPLTLVGSEWG